MPRRPRTVKSHLYLFKDKRHKRECLEKAWKLSEFISHEPPESKKQFMNYLLYLGVRDVILTAMLDERNIDEIQQRMSIKDGEMLRYARVRLELGRLAREFIRHPERMEELIHD